MTSVKLCESHPVRMCVQVGGDSSATSFDRQDWVVLSMRDVKARLFHPWALDDKTGREGHDAFEEVTVEQSQRNCVRIFQPAEESVGEKRLEMTDSACGDIQGRFINSTSRSI